MKTIKLKLAFYSILCCLSVQMHAQKQLTLESYQDKVISYSLQLKQQQQLYLADIETRKIADTEVLPQISLNAEATSNLSELDEWNSPKGAYRPYSYQALITAELPVYTGGALKANKEIAITNEAISLLNIELSKDQIYYHSAVYYWNVAASSANLKTANYFKEIVEQQYDLIKTRFEEGSISRTDLLMISTRLKEAELQCVRANKAYMLTTQNFNILMGISPKNPIDELSDIRDPNIMVSQFSQAEVLANRADYTEAQLNINKSEVERKAALSKYLPKVNLFVSGGWSTGVPYLGESLSLTPIAGASVHIPLINWGGSAKTKRQQQAYINMRKLELGQIADKITEELSAAKTNMTETSKEVYTASQMVKIAVENLDLITFSYNEGKGSMIEVLSAQLSWIQAHTNLIDAHLSEKIAIAEYRKVVSR